jgi:Phage integrase, N-terminal SAM-like domain
VLDEARRGTLAGMVRTGATFSDAAAEFLRYAEHDRGLKPSTLRGYRSIMSAYLLPAFGERRLEDITTADVERRSSATPAVCARITSRSGSGSRSRARWGRLIAGRLTRRFVSQTMSRTAQI